MSSCPFLTCCVWFYYLTLCNCLHRHPRTGDYLPVSLCYFHCFQKPIAIVIVLIVFIFRLISPLNLHLLCGSLHVHYPSQDQSNISIFHAILMMMCMIAIVNIIGLHLGCQSLLLHDLSNGSRNQHCCCYFDRACIVVSVYWFGRKMLSSFSSFSFDDYRCPNIVELLPDFCRYWYKFNLTLWTNHIFIC